MVEMWRPVKGFESIYEISSLGRVRSLDRLVNKWNGQRTVVGKIKTPTKNKHGYLYVDLYKNGVKTRFTIHRLVAAAFIPPVAGKPLVNHIDGNKQNNILSNLEWVTNQENQQFAVSTGQSKNIGDNSSRATPVIQYKNGIEVKRWKCIKTASRALNIQQANISACCANRRKTAGGYSWRYEENER